MSAGLRARRPQRAPCAVILALLFVLLLALVAGNSLLIQRSEFRDRIATLERRLASRERRELRERENPFKNSAPDNLVPNACREFLVQDHPSIDSLVARLDASHGELGGDWNACTHLEKYGLNFAPFFARYLAFELRPRTVLELGCGLGTTSDFLARFIPGGAEVMCVEPNAMPAEVFSRRAPPHAPRQLSVDLFDDGAPRAAAARACRAALNAPRADAGDALSRGFDLVFTLEVLEHIPAARHEIAADFLAHATRKWLVFSAARPGQGGTGHLPDSMRTADEWRAAFEARGLVFDIGATMALRRAAQERTYDLRLNTIVMRNTSTTLAMRKFEELPDPAWDLYGSSYDAAHIYYKYQSDGETGDGAPFPGNTNRLFDSPRVFCDRAARVETDAADAPRRGGVTPRTLMVRGQEQALWPELHLAFRRLVAGKLECGRGMINGTEWEARARPLRKYDCDPWICRQLQ